MTFEGSDKMEKEGVHSEAYRWLKAASLRKKFSVNFQKTERGSLKGKKENFIKFTMIVLKFRNKIIYKNFNKFFSPVKSVSSVPTNWYSGDGKNYQWVKKLKAKF